MVAAGRAPPGPRDRRADRAGSIDRDRAGRQLASFLAALHHPAARRRAEAAVGVLARPVIPPASAQTLRDRFGRWARPDQRRTVARWCGHQLSRDRVMAWHLRSALGDALWRGEAGIPLADHQTPPQWVDDLAVRFTALGIDPGVPPPAGDP